MKTHFSRVVLFFILAPTAQLGFAMQNASSPGTQKDINVKAQAAYQAGNAAVANNDFKAAEVQFATVVKLAPQIEEGHSSLGAVLISLGKFPQAINELQKALALKPGDVSAQTNLALAYERTGAYTKAIVLFKQVEAATRGGSNTVSPHALPLSVLAH